MKKQIYSQPLYLTWTLALREIKRKYKSATLGFAWIIINPLIQMLVLTIVFSLFFRLNIENYWLFALSGLLPWTFFSVSLTSATASLIENRDLIKKVPFAKELLPISSVIAHLITTSSAIFILLLFVILKFGFRWNYLFIAPLLFLETILVIGASLFLSSLEIYFRDVSFILQAGLVVWFYLTPVFYPLEMVPTGLLKFYQLNPMVGIVTSFQSVFLQKNLLTPTSLVISIISAAILLTLGVLVFRRRSQYFADWV